MRFKVNQATIFFRNCNKFLNANLNKNNRKLQINTNNMLKFSAANQNDDTNYNGENIAFLDCVLDMLYRKDFKVYLTISMEACEGCQMLSMVMTHDFTLR